MAINRHKRVVILVTDQELSRFQELAEKEELKVPEFVREVIKCLYKYGSYSCLNETE